MALGVVDFLEIRVVRDRFDAFLRGNNLIVTRHYGNRPEFETLGKMHGADRCAAARRLNVFVEYFELQAGLLDRPAGSVQLSRRPHENSYLVRFKVLLN